VSSLRNFR